MADLDPDSEKKADLDPGKKPWIQNTGDSVIMGSHELKLNSVIIEIVR